MAANYRGIPNHVQIGINDTVITVTLEKGDFKTAEQLIAENREPAYLDEGPFEKIPLTLVLSNETEFRLFPRHLRLAKLLVEGGANPNLRIPQAEWQGASPSPMEHLIDLYHLTLDNIGRTCCFSEQHENDVVEFVDPLFTIGLHDEVVITPEELKEQLLELLDIFLACGGNPNVTTTTSNSTLYHMVMARLDPDIDLLMKLCEAGGDLNQTNVHGTTPLMELVTYADGDLALDILYKIWQTEPNISSLLCQNCSNETSLWRAMFAGSPGVAIEFLQKGASPEPRALVTIGKWYKTIRPHLVAFSTDIALNGISYIFAPLLQDSSPNVRLTSPFVVLSCKENELPRQFNVHLLNKVFSMAINPVVDALPAIQCFPDPVINDITTTVKEETQFRLEPLLSTASKAQDVTQLMFGKLSAGLQQMCIRVIMNCVFFSAESSKTLAFIAQLKGKKIISQEEQKKQQGDSECWDEEASKKKESSEKEETESGMSLNQKDDGMPQNSNDNADLKENCEDRDKSDDYYSDSEELMEIELGNENSSCSSKNIVVEDIDNITDWNVVMELNSVVIDKLVKDHLKLPPSLISRFEIEAIRLQLGALLYTFESTDCIQGCDGQSDEESSDMFAEDESEESDWYNGSMSSDEYADDFNEYDSSEEDDDIEEEEDENEDEEECYHDSDGGGDANSDEAMELQTGNDPYEVQQENDAGQYDSSPSSAVSKSSEKDSAISEESSGDQVPDTVRRERYEPFDNDPCADTVSSSEDTSHSADNLKNV